MRVTRKTARLLRVLLNVHADREYAAKAAKGASYHKNNRAIMEEAHISASSFYVLMDRLERHGWVEGEWEVAPGGRKPRRRFYHLTEPGVDAARAAIRQRNARSALWRKLTGRPQ